MTKHVTAKRGQHQPRPHRVRTGSGSDRVSIEDELLIDPVAIPIYRDSDFVADARLTR